MQIFVTLPNGEQRCVSGVHSEDAETVLRRVPCSEVDCFFTFGGRPIRQGLTLGDHGVHSGCTVNMHRRARGGMLDTWMIVLIVLGVLLLIWLLYCILPHVFACLRWFWRRVLSPPIFFVYVYIMTPIGHCSRDCIFTTKEACCDCIDSCDMCCSPYKRI
mmetsp:Transcript_19910/g.32765  ORF Transcript_19910/g.32765 Transcript_19910/m.32765 type:complete len:160 (+) Transcript_19910:195-674(+)